MDEISTNSAGGKRSQIDCALDVVPSALLRVGRVLHAGERRYEDAPQQVGKENWRRIEPREHVRHALRHLMLWLTGDTSEEHLEHAACRILMAVEHGEP